METVNQSGIGRFYKTPKGVYPSVTTVISATADKGWLEEWRQRIGNEAADAIVKESTDIGTHLHLLFEQHLKGEPFQEPTNDREATAWKMFRLARPKFDRLVDQMIKMEEPVWSDTFRIAGRFDCLAKTKHGTIDLVDFKNTKGTKKREDINTYRQQLAFYRIMIKETLDIDVGNMIIFMVNRLGVVQQFVFKPEETPRSELVAIRKAFWEKYHK